MERICYATGETVTVHGQSGLWTVIHDDHDRNRIIVEQNNSACMADTTMVDDSVVTLIVKPRDVNSTRVEVAHPAVPLQQLPVVNANGNAIETIIMEATGTDHRGLWDPSAYFNLWVPLRALGGNSIMLRPRPPGHRVQPLILFPRIARLGLEVWFHSLWLGHSMQLIEVDALELCPQGQYWPKCMWCGKFHLPFDTHRVSRNHSRFCAHFIAPIEREEPGSARRQQLVDDLRRSTQAWRPVSDMAHMFVHNS